MKKTKSNFLWADLIRIFAIFGVICIHTIDPNASRLDEYIVKVSQTSVPLFVMLSGALLLGKSESYTSFFRKRTVKVLIPWISWTIIYMIFFYFIIKDSYVMSTYFANGLYLSNWIKFFLIQFMTGLWFLPLIFSLYFITPALRIFLKNAKDSDVVFLLIPWFFIAVLLPGIVNTPLFPRWESNLVYVVFQYLGFYFLGYLIQKNFTKKNFYTNYIVLLLIPISLLIPVSNFINLFTMIGSILFFIFFKNISSKIEKVESSSIRKAILLMGNASLGIYLIHQLLIFGINRFSTIYYAGIFFAVIVFCMSLAIVLAIKKIPILKIILT